jgi:uncharacterized membrane protein YhaH (DUF805 family)
MNVPVLSGLNGRTSRLRYWMTLLIAVPALIVVAIFFTSDQTTGLAGWAWMILFWIGGVLILALSAMRLHDMNASSWWLLLLYGGPYLLGIAGKALGDSPLGELMESASEIAVVIVILTLGLVPGSHGDNRFGSGVTHEA